MTLLPRWNSEEVHGGGPAFDLIGETDPSIYYQDLLTRSQELIDGGKTGAAIQVLQEVSQQELFPQLAGQAQVSMELLSGGGPWERQLERQAHSLPDHFFNAPTLLGMAAGGMAYRIGRGFAIRGLLSSSCPGLLEAAGIRLASGMAGMSLEVPVFAGTAHLLSGEAGGTFRDHLISTGITLGALRSFGWVGSQMGKLGAPRLAGLTGMYAGILSAQHLDPTQSTILKSEGLSPWLQGIITLAQFQAAGAAYRLVAPKPLQTWERYQDQRAEAALQNSVTRSLRLPPPPSLAYQMAEAHNPQSRSLRPRALENYFFSQGDPKLRRESTPISSTVEGFLESVPKMLAEDINLIYAEIGRDSRVLRMLTQTQVKDFEVYRRGVHRLASLLEHSKPDSGRGTYLDWITRHWLEQVVPEMRQGRLDAMVQRLALGGSLRELEKFMAQDLPMARLPEPQYNIDFTTPYEHHERAIDDLRIDSEAKGILRGWSREEEASPDPDIKIPPPKYFFLKFSGHNLTAAQSQVLESAVHLMAASPLGKYRLVRLGHILEIPSFDAHWEGKLRELADPNFRIWGAEHPDPPKDLGGFSHSQWDAYLGGKTAALLFDFAQRAHILSHPRNLRMREKRRLRILENFLLQKKEAGRPDFLLNTDDLVALLGSLGDPISREVAKGLRHETLDVEVHTRKNFNKRLEELGIAHPEKRRASYHPAVETKLAKDLILIRQPDFSNYSNLIGAKALTLLLQDVVHEGTHHLDYQNKLPDTHLDMLHVEMRGYTNEALWASEHGNPDFLVDFHRHSPYGFGQYLRNRLEALSVGVLNYPTRR